MKLIAFDLDGTLCERGEIDFMDGVSETLKAIFYLPDPLHIAIVTNQGGVGLRYWMEKEGFGNPEDYPTATDVMIRLSTIGSRLMKLQNATENRITLLASFAYQSKKTGMWSPTPPSLPEYQRQMWNPAWRKPDSGMLDYLIQVNNFNPSDCFMVGDSQEDELAAAKAGFEFVNADYFFGR